MKRKSSINPEGVRELLTKPYIFVMAGLAYLLIGTFSSFDPALALNGAEISVSPPAFIVFLFGLAAFYSGVKTSGYALRLSYLPVIAAVFLGIVTSYHVLGLNEMWAVILTLSLLPVSYVLLFSRMNWEYVFAAGTFMLWLSYVLNGIPLLDMQLHKDLFTHVNPVFMTGFFLMTYSLARLHPKRRFLWLFLILSLALSTFRLYMGIAFLAWLLLEIRDRKLDMLRLSSLLAGAVLVAMISIFIGYSITAGEHMTWQLDPLKTIQYRFAFTMSVFDDIVRLSMPWGHTYGASLTMESTEYMCRLLYGYEGRITATSFGEAMLNFGLIGVLLTAWWAGAVLGNLHRRDYALYAVLMAILIATLDVGINVFVIIGLTYLGWMRVIRHGDGKSV